MNNFSYFFQPEHHDDIQALAPDMELVYGYAFAFKPVTRIVYTLTVFYNGRTWYKDFATPDEVAYYVFCFFKQPDFDFLFENEWLLVDKDDDHK